jgi:hypothetical protein
MEVKKLDEVDVKLQEAKGAARQPLEIPDDSGVDVIVRGLGAYYGGYKKNFDTGEILEERIRNIGLVVLDPADSDPDKEMIFSVASETVLAKNLVDTFGNGSMENPELNMEFLNHKVFIGKKMVDTEGGRSYAKLVWYDYGKVDGLPENPATVGRNDGVADVEDIVDDVEV